MLGERKGKFKSCVQAVPDVVKNRFSLLWEQSATFFLLFVGMLAFKIASDGGFLWMVSQGRPGYPLDFSVTKYMVGLLCCLVLFFMIRHEEQKASSFFLYFVFLFQIVPITSVYAFSNRSSEYYLTLILAFCLCALVVGYTKNTVRIPCNRLTSKAVSIGFACIMVLIVLLLVNRYGIPSLAALNLFGVYELRDSGTFVLGKYESYLFNWTTAVILPASIALTTTKRKYPIVFILCGIMLVLYLYSAHKTFLFSIPLVLLTTLWSRRKNFYKELFTTICFAYLLLTILRWFSPVFEELIEQVFALFTRRVLLVPANNKFLYFDYFSNNPKMALGGVFPRWLIDIPNHYENIPYSYEISKIYYYQPKMNSNTGFLAEGYMRFGHIGTFGVLLLFSLILKLTDRFQDRVGYPLAVGVFIYQIYSLADAHLVDSLVLGPWMLLVIILLFYGYQAKNANGSPKTKRFRLFGGKKGI